MACAGKKRKLETVSLKTFKKWSFCEQFIPETDEEGNLVKLKCKICSENSDKIRREAKRRGINGPPLTSIINYIDGVSYIHKGNAEKHIRSGSLHDWAQANREAKGNIHTETQSTSKPKETNPLIKLVTQTTTKNYIRLFNTALAIVLAEKPFTDFPFAIDLQTRNGLAFLPMKNNYKACKQFVHYIAEAVRGDIRSMLSASNFICGEMDGSEARKTKEEKELVYCKLSVRGKPTELFLSCQKMSQFGGTDAKSTKAAFDSAFMDDYQFPEEQFNTLLVGVCADGASINMGRLTGACTEMKVTRPWLVVTHCINHRLELAMSDAFLSNASFKILDDMMINLYYHFRNSGKNKRLLMRLAERLNVSFVSFVNTKGTRFQSHHYNGIKAMLVNFVTLLLFMENMIEANNKTCKPETKAQLKGYHNQLSSYGFLGCLELYRQVLRLTTALSLIFQNESVLITDVIDALDSCKSGLQEIGTSTETTFPVSVEVNEITDQATFSVSGTNIPASLQFKDRGKMSEKQKQKADKCLTKVTETFSLKHVQKGIRQVTKVKEELVPNIAKCLDKRFQSSFQDPVMQAMRLADHTTWDTEDNNFGKAEVEVLHEHFAIPLAIHNFSRDLALRELNGVKKLKATKFRQYRGKLSFWERIFSDYNINFPHFLLLIEICLVMAFSSSTVERGFSTVKRHLTDSRLRLSNSSLNDLLVVRVNVPKLRKLDPSYESKVIQRAVDSYLTSPSLQRGRYHAAACSKTPGVTCTTLTRQGTDEPDLFLPVNAASLIDNAVAASQKDILVYDNDTQARTPARLSDQSEPELESDSDSDSSVSSSNDIALIVPDD